MRSDSQTLLSCPIRGPLDTYRLAKDGLTVTEEARRIEFLQFLLKRKYPKNNISVETVILKGLGESGRNKLRCDVIVYDRPVTQIVNCSLEESLDHAILVAEIKRDSARKKTAISCQLEPAMRLLPGMNVLGVYWDDVNHILFAKKLVTVEGQDRLDIVKDTIANLPTYGVKYRSKPITYDTLTTADNLMSILMNIANIMRSHGCNDEHTRYKETVKLLLARYCDERQARSSPDKVLQLQVFQGQDVNFMDRLNRMYDTAAQRYSRATTLFRPVSRSELKERTLREIVEVIQGVNFSAASNSTMQQVFMSFVPAVFKKSLDQYFTPISLINSIVHMVRIGPNDTIADPAMGTADFLTAAMEYGEKQGDADIVQRIYGVDSDQKAYDLAVVNMILNKDGQSNLVCKDSIESHSMWNNTINVVLCNPPFGGRSIENRPEVLKHYDLGHRWEYNEREARWEKTEELLPSQQLGILFIERSFKLLANYGRLGIILPEGYLCTSSYGYVRQWIVDNLRLLSLVELPRRIFTASNADLRSNIVIAQKLPKEQLQRLVEADYPIHADIVRKVGYKLGKGFRPTSLRDANTGLEIRDENNRLILDSDFERICGGFDSFIAELRWNPENPEEANNSGWLGARISDVLKHNSLDLKPRRLMPRALRNVEEIKGGEHKRLGDIADVLDHTIDLVEEFGNDAFLRLVEGLHIRAVEGTVVPGLPSRVWRVVSRKSKTAYKLKNKDIIVGLVRPERRNIGLLLDSGDDDLVGATDGIGVVRVKPEYADTYPQEWLFAVLRSESCRIQLWTESGGTSYGKLTREHILDVLLPVPDQKIIEETTRTVSSWANAIQSAVDLWNEVGTSSDRRPIVNSSAFGLVEVDGDEDEDEEDED